MRRHHPGTARERTQRFDLAVLRFRIRLDQAQRHLGDQLRPIVEQIARTLQ